MLDTFTISEYNVPTMKTIKKHAWAIERTYKDIDGKIYRGLLGVYYFNSSFPVWAEGNTTALFRTRELARKYCKTLKSNHSRFRVVKTKIIIKT